MNGEKNGLSFPNEADVRRVWVSDEWWYVLDDVIASFVYPGQAEECLLEIRNLDVEFDRWCNNNTKLLSYREKNVQEVLCFVNLEGVFRVIQSIPSVYAEPFKLWLSKLAKKRLQSLN